eukprot:10486433-Alexandrium_andersonii.AAC.1
MGYWCGRVPLGPARVSVEAVPSFAFLDPADRRGAVGIAPGRWPVLVRPVQVGPVRRRGPGS